MQDIHSLIPPPIPLEQESLPPLPLDGSDSQLVEHHQLPHHHHASRSSSSTDVGVRVSSLSTLSEADINVNLSGMSNLASSSSMDMSQQPQSEDGKHASHSSHQLHQQHHAQHASLYQQHPGHMSQLELALHAQNDPEGMLLEELPDLTIKDILLSREKATASRGKVTRRRKRGPKAASSAFAFYRFEVLGDICEQHPTLPPEETMQLVEAKWTMLPDSEKMIYETKAQQDDLRYGEEVKLYLPKSQGGYLPRKKAKKHPAAPKHPMSAYLYFVHDNRQKLKQSYPDKGFTEIARMLGEQWRKLDPGARSLYQQRATVDKERYKSEKDTFQPPPLEEPKEAKRRKKHPLAPKHPLSAYLFFVATNRPKMNAEHPEKDFTEVARILGQMWKNLPPHQKKKYEILAFADKKRYLEEKEKWTPPADKTKKVDAKAPRSPKGKGFREWMSEQRPIEPNELKQNQVRAMRDKWRSLPEEPKLYMQDDSHKMVTGYDHPGIPVSLQPVMEPHAGSMGKKYRSPPLDPKRRGRPRKYQASAEVLAWNSHEIGRFIASLGLQEHKDKFVRSGITGDQFVKLSSPQLRDNFYINNIGDRKKIIKGIQNLLK